MKKNPFVGAMFLMAAFLLLSPPAQARKTKKKAYEHTVVEIPAGQRTVIPVETELDTVGGKAFDSKKYLEAARAAVEERVCELIRVCGQ